VIVRFGRLATSWTCMFRVLVTGEHVTVGSFTDRDDAVTWARDDWFHARADFEGVLPLVRCRDFVHELDNVEMTTKPTGGTR
jgi:hypothetical protein